MGKAEAGTHPGVVYWFTGLAGSGKSTLGRAFTGILKQYGRSVIFLDGDSLREVFGNDLGHTIEDRKRSAMRNGRLCKMLVEQGVDVVCATISMFRETQQWNRENLPKYKEVYVRVPMAVLLKRDQKGLYSGAQKGEIKNVMGVDLKFDEPESPDLVIDNDGTKTVSEIEKHMSSIILK